MRAVIAIAALAVAVNAAAIPDGTDAGAGLPAQIEGASLPSGALDPAGRTHPSGSPSGQPSGHPTGQPTGQPSGHPTGQPSGHPTGQPTGQPSGHPTGQPSGHPTGQPTGMPTGHPTGHPTGPTGHPTDGGHDGNPKGNGDDYPKDNSGDDYDHSSNNYDDNSSSNYDDNSSSSSGSYTYSPKDNTYGGKNYGDSPKDYTSSKNYDYSQYSSASSDYKSNYGSYTVKPDYPSGGYSPPAAYPPSCGWSKPKPSPPADCDYNTHDWPYNANWPPAGDYGKSKPHYDYSPKGHTQAEGCGVYYPVRGQQVECGKKHNFLWYMPHSSHVQIDLVYGSGADDCHHYTTIHDNCPNTGSYEWDVPQIAPCGNGGGYGILVTCKDTGRKYYSPQFDFSSPDFYNTCKHPACPTAAPPVCEIPACTQCTPPPPPPTCPATNVAAPPTYSAPAAAPATNETTATYTNAASSVGSSFSLVAGIAAMVALIL